MINTYYINNNNNTLYLYTKKYYTTDICKTVYEFITIYSYILNVMLIRISGKL